MKRLFTKIKNRLIREVEERYSKVEAYFKEIYLQYLNRTSVTTLDSTSDKVVVSLTTFPARIEKVALTIESIFHQKVKPDVVHLWLAALEFPDEKLPESLRRLEKRGLKISFVDENIRSYKKLIYSLKEYPESIIITTDDDVFYPSYWLEKLIDTHQKYPEDIVCYRGHNLKLTPSGELEPYRNLLTENHVRFPLEASYSLLPTGVSGILYPPHSLHPEVFNQQKFMELAPNGDDIWFKCCGLLNNTKSRRVFTKNIHFSEVRGSQAVSLYSLNVFHNKNDEQLKKVFDAYKLQGMLKEENVLQF
jgi:hypothetical protein